MSVRPGPFRNAYFPRDSFAHSSRRAPSAKWRTRGFPDRNRLRFGCRCARRRSHRQNLRGQGRPAFNPLIVHVADTTGAQTVALWNERAQTLADAFWPGPLTLILPSRGVVCAAVSAGLPSVAVRVPDHPVALKLLRRSELVLAAPSANASQQISPTRAAHVAASLGADIWVLDGGACEIGLESTVLDLTGATARILRPGALGERELKPLIGELSWPDDAATAPDDDETPRTSPGQMAKHYAPRARVRLFSHLTDAHFHAVALGDGKKLGVIALEPTTLKALELVLPDEPIGYARALYAALHAMDEAKVELILIEEPPAVAAWSAVRDRLNRMIE